MSNENESPQLQTLPSSQVTVVNTENNHVTFIDSRQNQTGTVTLRATQAMKLQKLLSMPGDPLPSYRGEKRFFLAVEPPTHEDYSPHPIVEVDGPHVSITGQADNEITIHATEHRTLCALLNQWGVSMGTSDGKRSILSLPAMIQLEDGIAEPILHTEYDEVLEHYHQAVGYWSPEKEAYVVTH
jgi:hypothetical protein